MSTTTKTAVIALAKECAIETWNNCFVSGTDPQDAREWEVARGDLEALQDLVDCGSPEYDDLEEVFVDAFSEALGEIADEHESDEALESATVADHALYLAQAHGSVSAAGLAQHLNETSRNYANVAIRRLADDHKLTKSYSAPGSWRTTWLVPDTTRIFGACHAADGHLRWRTTVADLAALWGNGPEEWGLADDADDETALQLVPLGDGLWMVEVEPDERGGEWTTVDELAQVPARELYGLRVTRP